MKIYTRQGDDGTTGTFRGDRVSKTEQRIVAVGEVDELNACLGLAVAAAQQSKLRAKLVALQHILFDLGAELATPSDGDRPRSINASQVEQLERDIDQLSTELPELRAFILPGGNELASRLHLARCVSRRAERAIVALARDTSVSALVLAFANRLSDLLFVMARFANQEAGQGDVLWEKAPST